MCAPMNWEHYVTYRSWMTYTEKELINIMKASVFWVHKPYLLMPGHKFFLDALDLCRPIKAPKRSYSICTDFSALHGQEKAVWKSRPGYLLLFYQIECVLILSMIWSNKMHFICCTKVLSFPKSGHKFFW